MLIEFRVENHRSLGIEQVLGLEAARIGEAVDSCPRQIAGHAKKLLPASALYGANASGKSNVLSALSFMRDAVLDSHRSWEPEGGVPRMPFAWGGKRREPSLFEVSFVAHNCRYNYGFVANDASVLEEWLYAWPHGTKQVWFERDLLKFKFGEHLKGEKKSLVEVCRANALFLSVAAQHGQQQLLPLYEWFRRILPIRVQSEWAPLNSFRFALERPVAITSGRGLIVLPSYAKSITDVISSIRKLLVATDTGIEDVKVTGTPQELGSEAGQQYRVLLQHQAGNDDSWLDLQEESKGTQTLFDMAVPILEALACGGVLLVDELESSLHPLVGQAIIRLFNSPVTNPRHAQIVFTTHDTNLLGTTLGSPLLRRDQIWLTEKDQAGNTHLFPLTDFKPRKVENLERGYLQGRYGAVPFLDISMWQQENPA